MMVNVDDFIYICELQPQEGEFLPSEHIRQLFEKVVARRETIILHFTSPRLTSPHFTSPHLTSPCLTSLRLTGPL